MEFYWKKLGIFGIGNFVNYSIILVYLRCVGGEVGATSSLAPKIGPLGLVIIIGIFKISLIITFPIFHFSLFNFSHQKRLVMTLPRRLVTGRAWKSQSAWQSKTDRPQSQSYHQPLHWLWRPSRNLHVIVKRWKIVSILAGYSRILCVFGCLDLTRPRKIRFYREKTKSDCARKKFGYQKEKNDNKKMCEFVICSGSGFRGWEVMFRFMKTSNIVIIRNTRKNLMDFVKFLWFLNVFQNFW